MVCDLCPRGCTLAEYERGACRDRIAIGGKLYTLVYGRPCAVHVDPIEKKPLFHVLPSSRAFSIATAGCCLSCDYCQNWTISQAAPEDTPAVNLSPSGVVDEAVRSGCRSIAYTYTEPTVFYEYMYDTALLARERGLLNLSITCGYINEKPLRQLCKVMDAANVDLKGFSEEFYRRVCRGSLRPVLDAIRIMHEEGVFVEITNLVVPGLNDDESMIRDMCRWIVETVGPEVPLHFSRFHPAFRLRNLPPTPVETLLAARRIARAEGVLFVYVGNVFVRGGEDTRCPECNALLVRRLGFEVLSCRVDGNGRCPECGRRIPGIWKADR